MVSAINTFRNVRARLVRSQDGTPLTGWVHHLGRDQARIRLWGDLPLAQGERVKCECFGQGNVASFTGVVIGKSGSDLALAIVGSIAYAPSAEPPRIHAEGLQGEIRGTKVKTTLSVLDVSPASLGAVVDAELDRSDKLVMTLSTDAGPIEAEVTIANIHPHAGREGAFRVGLHLAEMSRLDRARWGRLLVERAEA